MSCHLKDRRRYLRKRKGKRIHGENRETGMYVPIKFYFTLSTIILRIKCMYLDTELVLVIIFLTLVFPKNVTIYLL